MPPTNDRRRAQLTDAAIELLAEAGVHGVTHRSVERRAGLPTGTASNYFRSREALLVATAERIVALHHADMDRTAQLARAGAGPAGPVDLIAGSLLTAATTLRGRYLAIFELRLEGLRRPALAGALVGLYQRSIDFTRAHHAELDLTIPPDAVPSLVTLYGGALFTLVTSAPGEVTAAGTRAIAESVVRGALGAASLD